VGDGGDCHVALVVVVDIFECCGDSSIVVLCATQFIPRADAMRVA
jgi:hypothetical protein